jgi:hypothetical protein
VAVHNNTELKVIEKEPYPPEPSICLNKGMDPAVMNMGIMMLTR